MNNVCDILLDIICVFFILFVWFFLRLRCLGFFFIFIIKFFSEINKINIGFFYLNLNYMGFKFIFRYMY